MRITFVLSLVLGSAALAQDMPAPITYSADISFDDAAFAVESAITNAGLVIEGTSHVGEMLARTKADVGGNVDLFTHATVFTFCSAQVSRQVMEADPLNIQHCPYAIFVYATADAPAQITMGHRSYSGTMAPVNDLLEKIIKDALMLD